MSDPIREAIGPCRFCESTQTALVCYSGAVLERKGVCGACFSCGARGPAKPNQEQAIAAWNCRDDGWRDISEAPRDGTEILAYIPSENVTPCFWQDDTWFTGCMVWSCRSDGHQVDPTHFRPLPAPPGAA